MELREDNPSSPALAALMALHIREARAVTPAENAHVMEPSELAREKVTFWTARDGAEIAGMVALKELDAYHGEIKSMRTAPGFLRRGVARELLDHAIGEARSRGYARVSLETGTHAHFGPANRLYESVGFSDGPVFGGYPESPHNRFMTLSL